MKSTLILFIGAITVLSYTSCNTAGASATSGLTAMQTTPEGLSWFAIDDLDQMKDLKGKKIMIDMYTSWCGWCKVMDNKTFTDPEVVSYLNENFVLVKFNAEQKEPVVFKGETYEWLNHGRKGVNKLAMQMMNGRLGYPTMVYLNDQKEVVKSSPGYKTPEQLLAELKVL
jgi:thioredoxin-related protein